ncbi:hypothetical protein [Pararhizobium sp. DWP3-4]|uniref:hypothetical protein n=1 Tax=Pararhizobium sp. DWP3-4 TaxID=2804565 RepID=UPI003CF21DFA
MTENFANSIREMASTYDAKSGDRETETAAANARAAAIVQSFNKARTDFIRPAIEAAKVTLEEIGHAVSIITETDPGSASVSPSASFIQMRVALKGQPANTSPMPFALTYSLDGEGGSLRLKTYAHTRTAASSSEGHLDQIRAIDLAYVERDVSNFLHNLFELPVNPFPS